MQERKMEFNKNTESLKKVKWKHLQSLNQIQNLFESFQQIDQVENRPSA
jgi:hypothetical protein